MQYGFIHLLIRLTSQISEINKLFTAKILVSKHEFKYILFLHEVSKKPVVPITYNALHATSKFCQAD